MRYDHSVRAAKTLLDSGVIGEPVFATIEMRGIPHWMDWHKDLGWLTLRICPIISTLSAIGSVIPRASIAACAPTRARSFHTPTASCTYILEILQRPALRGH